MIVIDEITDADGGSAVVRIFARDFARLILEREAGVEHAREMLRDARRRLEELEKRHELEVTLLRDALCTMLVAKTKDAKKDAEKEAKQALSATEPVPFLPGMVIR